MEVDWELYNAGVKFFGVLIAFGLGFWLALIFLGLDANLSALVSVIADMAVIYYLTKTRRLRPWP